MSNIVIQDLNVLTQTIVDDTQMFVATNTVKVLYDQLLTVVANIASIQKQIDELQTRLTTEQATRSTVAIQLNQAKSDLKDVLKNSIMKNL